MILYARWRDGGGRERTTESIIVCLPIARMHAGKLRTDVARLPPQPASSPTATNYVAMAT